ncbi:hypothetical protein D9615_003788 [Tricholomella constricta]|uniref:Uncharacterized protein n=1 Tax=Tricholomella constricta TaxID=117010 RepID=A0A8H5M726_9AGAR|nr:hypothetical protein D9615_003788 [Tricholomella constricta]
MRSLILLAAAVVFAPLCSATPIGHKNFDPKCGEGMHPGFETNIFQYDVPAQNFFDKTGSFFHSEWYTGPLLESTGEDDTVGATRSGNFSGTLFRERLVGYSSSSDELMHRYTLDNGPILFGDVLFGSYTEEMVILSICEGTATWISFTDVYCADKAAAAYNMYDRARRVLMDKLADDLGAMLFAGSCPGGHME